MITDCLRDEDFSIRTQALDLETAIVTSDTLQFVVNTLLGQMRSSLGGPETPANFGDVGDNDLGGRTLMREQVSTRPEPLPNDYRVEVLHRIVDICSRNNYSELPDFEWYIDVLLQLVVLLPRGLGQQYSPQEVGSYLEDIASRLGSEIRNIAVRVKSIRMEVTRAAESLVLTASSASVFAGTNSGVLGPIVWVVGEYAEFLAYPDRVIRSLTNMENASLPTQSLSLYLQAVPKVFIRFANHHVLQDAPGKDEVLSLLERVIEFFEALAAHPDLDIQERSVEFLEILRLAAEAIRSADWRPSHVPLLLSTAMPGLFSGLELNPVSTRAQRKVPTPENLILDHALNDNLPELFDDNQWQACETKTQRAFHDFYYSHDASEGHFSMLDSNSPAQVESIPHHVHRRSAEEEAVAIARRRAERMERNKDDPFYIGAEEHATPTSFSRGFNSSEIDVDSIPIVDLTINEGNRGASPAGGLVHESRKPLRPRDIGITADETIGDDHMLETSLSSENRTRSSRTIRQPPLLQVDSSSLGQVSLEDGDSDSQNRMGGRRRDDMAMAKAMQNVEKARLEMQRESERIGLEGIPTEGTLVKKKKKKSVKKRSKKRARGSSEGAAGSVAES